MEEQYLSEEFSEIDFRKYIKALFKWWWVIGLCAALAGAAALVVSLMISPTYEAKASVVALQTEIEVSLGSSIVTTTDLDISLAEAARGVAESRVERRLTSMAGLVSSGAIVEQVSEELKYLLTEEERQPSELLRHVTGQLQKLKGTSENSETIEIVVTYSDPEKAAAIANSWGQNYETHVNQIYGEASVSPFINIEQQLADVKDEYDQVQAALVSFLKEKDRVAEFNRQIAEEELVIEKLRLGRQDYTAAVVDTQVEAQKRLYDTTIASQLNSNLTVFEKQKEEVLRALNLAYSRKHRLEELLEEAQLMRNQLVEGGNASARSNLLALVAFKSRVFAVAEGLPFHELNLQVPSVGALSPESNVVEQLYDLDALISAMKDSLAEQEKIIVEESAALSGGEKYEFLSQLSVDSVGVSGSQSEEALTEMENWEGLLVYSMSLSGNITREIQSLEDDVRILKAEVESISKQKISLENERDLVWQTYTALLSKAQEIEVAQGARGTVVRFSSPAVVPSRPVSPSTIRNIALALAVGLMLGVGGAIMGEYMEVEPPALPAFVERLTRKKA